MASRSTSPKPDGSACQLDALLALVRLLARQAARESLGRALEVEDRDAGHPAAGGSPHP